MSRTWQIRLTAHAELDLVDIAKWTTEHFGTRQAKIYSETIARAVVALTDGPDAVGVKPREDLAPGIKTLHAARLGRKSRHFVVFRVRPGKTIEILRVLHDSMDFARHVTASNEDLNEPNTQT